jgi:predicted cation transporter
MNPAVATALIALLLIGPVVSRIVEEHIEVFFAAVGVVAMTLAGAWEWDVLADAVTVPLWITIAVIVAGLVFDWMRQWMDRVMVRMRERVALPLLCGSAVFAIALLSAVITAMVAALVLVETAGLLRLNPVARLRVVVVGCFAIGLGSSLTPLGGPLSTLAASGLGLGATGLFNLLAPYVLPGMVACAILGAIFVLGDKAKGASPAVVLALAHLGETFVGALLRGLKVYVFIAALVLVGHAFAPLVVIWLPKLGRGALFWANMASAAMDNATLVAVEIHAMDSARAREAIIALLIAGGMLIPGNIPNIIAAASLRIRAAEWAKLGVPIGLALLGIYFAVLQAAG